MADFLPDREGDFFTWEQGFVTYVSGHLVALGLVQADLDPVEQAQGGWENALVDAQAKEAAAAAAVQLKRSTRETFTAAIRTLVRKLQASAAVSDEERAAMGITVPDSQPTPTGAPTTRPVLIIDTSQPGRLIIRFADEGTPTKKRKPAGVMAILLQICKGTAPTGDSSWAMLAIDTATPYIIEFDSAEAGVPVWIRGCWLSTHQEQGPWSGVVTARVPG